MEFSKKDRINIRRYSVLILIIVLFMFACSKSKQEPANKSENKTATQSGKTDSLSAETSKKELIPLISKLDELKNLIDTSGNTLLVFDLYADWCMPCRALSPTLTTLASANTENARFFRINVDKSRDIAAEFGVNGIPFVVFVKNKEAIYAITGLNPREKYEKVIASCGTAQTTASCKGKLEKEYY